MNFVPKILELWTVATCLGFCFFRTALAELFVRTKQILPSMTYSKSSLGGGFFAAGMVRRNNYSNKYMISLIESTVSILKMCTYPLRQNAVNTRQSQDTQAIYWKSPSCLKLRLRSKANLSADMASNRYWSPLWHWKPRTLLVTADVRSESNWSWCYFSVST